MVLRFFFYVCLLILRMTKCNSVEDFFLYCTITIAYTLSPRVLVSLSDKDIYEQVNFSSGRYFSGNSNDLGARLPFDAGFEVLKNVIFVSSVSSNFRTLS